MTSDEIKIVNLADEQEFLPEVSEWIWKEWARKNGAKLEDVIYRSKHSIKRMIFLKCLLLNLKMKW